MIIKYIDYIKPTKATGLIKDIYSQIERDFGSVVGPFVLHSLIPELLAINWCVLRETNLVEHKVRREIKDAIAVAVSKINKCPWCVDAHSIMLIGLKSGNVASAVEKNRIDLIKNHRIRSIVEWALATRSPNSEVVNNPPFTANEAPEIIGTAVYYHYINKMVSILLGETPLPIKSSLLKGFTRRIGVLMFSVALKRHKRPGESLRFIDEHHPDKKVSWTSGNPEISMAFASHANIVENLAEKYIPEKVKVVLREYIKNWDGKDPGISRNWVEKYISHLYEPFKAQARLILLCAISPYQIDEKIIISYRQSNSTDEALLTALSWASFTTAMHIGNWLGKSFQDV